MCGQRPPAAVSIDLRSAVAIDLLQQRGELDTERIGRLPGQCHAPAPIIGPVDISQPLARVADLAGHTPEIAIGEPGTARTERIGRACCRERACQYAEISVLA